MNQCLTFTENCCGNISHTASFLCSVEARLGRVFSVASLGVHQPGFEKRAALGTSQDGARPFTSAKVNTPRLFKRGHCGTQL